MRPMFGAFGKASSAHSIAFVSRACNLFLSHSPLHTHKHRQTVTVTVTDSHYSWLLCHKQEALDNGVKAAYRLDKRVEALNLLESSYLGWKRVQK